MARISRLLLLTFAALFTTQAGSYTPPPDPIPPAVSLGIAYGTTVSGLFSLTASATDNVRVESVSFYSDGSLLATVTAYPYVFAWNTVASLNGAHVLRAVARDQAGNASEAETVVSVNNTPLDLISPTIEITSPLNGQKIGPFLTVKVTASDTYGVSRVTLIVDGTLWATNLNPPFTFVCRMARLKPGSHRLLCRAYDRAGNRGDSSLVQFYK